MSPKATSPFKRRRSTSTRGALPVRKRKPAFEPFAGLPPALTSEDLLDEALDVFRRSSQGCSQDGSRSMSLSSPSSVVFEWLWLPASTSTPRTKRSPAI